MVFLELYTLPNVTNGMDTLLVDTITVVPGFTSLVLAFVFFIVFLGGIARQNLKTGSADYSMWSVVASLSTFMIALIMSTITGIINLDLLVIVIVVTIFSGVWLFLDRMNN